MESKPMLTPREISPLPEAQRRIEPMTLHEAGQQDTTPYHWAILAHVRWSKFLLSLTILLIALFHCYLIFFFYNHCWSVEMFRSCIGDNATRHCPGRCSSWRYYVQQSACSSAGSGGEHECLCVPQLWPFPSYFWSERGTQTCWGGWDWHSWLVMI